MTKLYKDHVGVRAICKQLVSLNLIPWQKVLSCWKELFQQGRDLKFEKMWCHWDGINIFLTSFIISASWKKITLGKHQFLLEEIPNTITGMRLALVEMSTNLTVNLITHIFKWIRPMTCIPTSTVICDNFRKKMPVRI